MAGIGSSSKATIAALATVALWASAFPFIRIGLRSFDPVPLAALRFFVAAIVVAGWLFWHRPRLPPFADMLRLMLCAAIGIAAYNILLNSGQRTVSAGAASFIVNTVPVITALIALVFLRERFGLGAWIGTAVSFAGITVIAGGLPGGLQFGEGAIVVLAAAVCQAVFFTLQRPLVATYGAKLCAAWVILLGSLFLIPWLPEAIAQARNATTSGVASMIYLGVFPAAIGYATWGVAQAHFGASRAANFLYLVPPFATGLALLIASETPTASTLAGGSIAIAGVLIVNKTNSSKPNPKQGE